MPDTSSACHSAKKPLDTIGEAGEEGEDDEETENSGEEEINISESRSTTSGSEAGSSDLILMLDDIANIISCLYHLSVAPVPRHRLQKYAEIDVTHYEYFDNQHVLERFPLTKPFLIKRLGNASTQRRQYFKYRLLHHEKIAKGLDGPLQPVFGGLSIVESTDPANQDTATAITASC